MPLSLIYTIIGLFIFTVVVFIVDNRMTPKMKEAELSLDLIRLRTYTNKNELRYMTHRDFEYYVADFLRLTRDLKTYVTQAAKDGGKDIIAFDDDEKIYVEVKHWKGNVGRPAIQKLNGAMLADKVRRGYFITSSGFTKDALEYAQKTNITLINGDDLIKQLHT
jgi:HJR/Mrr/RecB family endonuclease